MQIRVAWRFSLNLTGTVLKWFALPLSLPVVVALLYGESTTPFLVAIGVTLAVGLSFEQFDDDARLGPREALLMVALTWLLAGLVGAIPFVVAGRGTIAHPVNAAFESMSGLTTTGATVLREFDIHANSIMFWRQFIQWIGGLGILILATAVLSRLSVGGAKLMETETQYDNVDKLSPQIEDTARLILKLYVGLTVAAVGVLYGLHLAGLAPNMTLFNAVAHAFTSVSTAGFSPEPLSIEAFEPVVHWALMPIMFLGSTSFLLMYFVLQGNTKRLRNSEEFWFYFGTVVVVAGLIVSILGFVGNPTGNGFGDTLRQSLFNVISIVTTTGYANADFNQWPTFAAYLLFVCMFIGGMAGSTTCSIKSFRWVVVFKAFRRDLFTVIHPEAIRPLRLSGRVVDEKTVQNVYSYTLIAVVGVFVVTAFIVVDGARTGLYDAVDITAFDALGAAASTFLNIGPAFGPAGPYGTYDVFPTTTKAVMVLVMWVGRIEIVPVLVLLTRSFWES